MRSKLKKAICIVLVILSLVVFAGNSPSLPPRTFWGYPKGWQSEQLSFDFTNYVKTAGRVSLCSFKVQEGYFPFVLQLDGEERVEGYAYHKGNEVVLFYDTQSMAYDKSASITLNCVVLWYGHQRKLVVHVVEDNYFNKYADTFIELTPAELVGL